MTDNVPASDTPEIGYEQARDELIALVQKLEAGGTSLDESLALWERGEQLAGICQHWLDGAKARLAAASNQNRQDVDSDEM
ncbi:exodeoxyribonuclease VII small subunit [Aeromicrobium sp. P5_D10]